MANEATSIRYLHQALTIPDGAHKHQLQLGTWMTAPHSANQHDPALYPDPYIQARSVLHVDSETVKKPERYGDLKPWRVGANMYKGRTFAEKEILAAGACIITLWDIKPAEGKWKVPGMGQGVGVMRPVEAARVAISRRQLEPLEIIDRFISFVRRAFPGISWPVGVTLVKIYGFASLKEDK